MRVSIFQRFIVITVMMNHDVGASHDAHIRVSTLGVTGCDHDESDSRFPQNALLFFLFSSFVICLLLPCFYLLDEVIRHEFYMSV